MSVLLFAITKQYEYLHGFELRTYLIIIFNVTLLLGVGYKIFYFALELDNTGIDALSWTMSSFISNVLGAGTHIDYCYSNIALILSSISEHFLLNSSKACCSALHISLRCCRFFVVNLVTSFSLIFFPRI